MLHSKSRRYRSRAKSKVFLVFYHILCFRSQVVLAENPTNQSSLSSLTKSHLTVDDFQAKKLEQVGIPTKPGNSRGIPNSSTTRPRIISNHYHHTYEFSSRGGNNAEVAEIETVL